MRYALCMKRAVLTFAAAFLLAAPASAQTLAPLQPDIDAIFARFQAEAHVPGMVLSLIHISEPTRH